MYFDRISHKSQTANYPFIYALSREQETRVEATLAPNMLKNCLRLICSKIYLLFLPELPKIFTYYSYFIPKHDQLFLFYSVVSMIISQCRIGYI